MESRLRWWTVLEQVIPASRWLPDWRRNWKRDVVAALHAKQLLRHRSVGTTEAYLHPSMDDLTAAMRSMGDGREPK
jgi:hypothetical protein